MKPITFSYGSDVLANSAFLSFVFLIKDFQTFARQRKIQTKNID